MPRAQRSPLADMQHQPLGRQPGGQRQAQIGRCQPALLHPQRAVAVLGHGLCGDAADLFERRAADDRAGAAEEGRVPEVVARAGSAP